MGIEFRAIDSKDTKELAYFFGSLSDESLEWQNHFGKANDLSLAQHLAENLTANPVWQKGFVASGPYGVSHHGFNATVRESVIVAYGWLDLGQKETQKYTCSLGIVVTDTYQNKGIGTQLTKFMIEEARKLGMRKIWLNCYRTNQRAFKMYEKLGFKIEGIFQKQEWTKDNVPLDLYSLALFL